MRDYRAIYKRTWNTCKALDRLYDQAFYGFAIYNTNDFKQGVFNRLPKKWRTTKWIRKVVSSTVNNYLGLVNFPYRGGYTSYGQWLYLTGNMAYDFKRWDDKSRLKLWKLKEGLRLAGKLDTNYHRKPTYAYYKTFKLIRGVDL